MTLRYRSSGPKGGDFFARPKALPSHIDAKKLNSYIERQSQDKANLLKQQVTIEILDLDASCYQTLPPAIMGKVGGSMGYCFTENKEIYDDLKTGQWRACVRDNAWTGRILIQCGSIGDVKRMYTLLHGVNICMDGGHKTLDVSSPTDVFLHNNNGTAPPAASASS